VITEIDALTSRLADAGFVAARDEALELLELARDEETLESMIVRRLRGEPLAWITGSVNFCDLKVNIDVGVYVPRWQSEPLTRRAVSRLPPRGTSIDLCTGAGAIAAVLRAHHPAARVVATELDDRACACARSNGVEVYRGDLYEPLPRDLESHVDVIVAVVPYVPTASLDLLPRDTFSFESTISYDGGPNGIDVLRRVILGSPRYLRAGGTLLVELGGEQTELLREDLRSCGFRGSQVFVDGDGDVRGLEATFAP
jgi:release factor glutamine methyltransferase